MLLQVVMVPAFHPPLRSPGAPTPTLLGVLGSRQHSRVEAVLQAGAVGGRAHRRCKPFACVRLAAALRLQTNPQAGNIWDR